MAGEGASHAASLRSRFFVVSNTALGADAIATWFEQPTFSSRQEAPPELGAARDRLVHAVRAVNEVGWDEGLEAIGAVAAHFSASGNVALVARTGAGHCYRVRGRVCQQLTGRRREPEASDSPGQEAASIEMLSVDVEPFDRVLLCSCSALERISVRSITAAMVGASDLQEAVRAVLGLLNEATTAGGAAVLAVSPVPDMAMLPLPEDWAETTAPPEA